MLNDFWNIGFFSEVHDQYRMWGFLENKNGLCEVDLINNTAKLIAILGEERMSQDRLFHHIYRFGDELLLLPGTAKHIYIYNIKENNYKQLDLSGDAAQYNRKQYGFVACVSYKNRIFFLGGGVSAIVVWEHLNNEMTVLKIPFDDISCKEIDVKGFCTDGYIVESNVLLVALGCDNVLLKIDMESLRVEVLHVDIICNGFSGIASGHNGLWIEDSGDLLFFDRCKGEHRRIEICSQKKRQSFYAPICISNKVYMFPLYAEKAYVYDIECDKVFELKKINEIICNKKRKLSLFTTLGLSVEDSCISFFSGSDFAWYRLDCEEEVLSSLSLRLERNDKYYHRYVKDYMKSKTLIEEIEMFSMPDYLEYIKLCSNS